MDLQHLTNRRPEDDLLLRALWLRWFEQRKHYGETRDFNEYAEAAFNRLVDLITGDM